MTAGTLASCADCLGWGILPRSHRCDSCYNDRRFETIGPCEGCGRIVGIKQGSCIMCRVQVALLRGFSKIQGPLLPDDLPVTFWQLGLINVKRMAPCPRPVTEPVVVPRPSQIPGQLALFTIPERRYDGFVRARDANFGHHMVTAARATAARLSELNGWSRNIDVEVDLALLMLLSDHAEDDNYTYVQVAALDKRVANVGHTVEVLQELGLFAASDSDPVTRWLSRNSCALPESFVQDLTSWADEMRLGTARRKPREPLTVCGYLRLLLPVLLDWAQRYAHLREVTPDDVKALARSMSGWRAQGTLVALHSLFGYLKRRKLIFRNPTARISPPGVQLRIPQRLPGQPGRSGPTFTLPPAGKVILALAAVHAARPKAIPLIQLTDVDMPYRRLTIGGLDRYLDDATHRAIEDYLAERARLHPRTTNPYLLVTTRSAARKTPAGGQWINFQIRGLGTTLNPLRFDRQLDEALATGADALHLSIVFGISQTSAVRFAQAAAELLDLPGPARSLGWIKP